MKGFILFSGIIIILLMILMFFDKNTSMMEAFGTLPVATQSSFIPSDIPGATTTNPTVAKPTHKEIIDARDTIYQFMNMCKNIKLATTEQQLYQNLKNGAPIFLNEISALENNPDIVNASNFYSKWNTYKKAIQKISQRPVLEGFVTKTASLSPQDISNLLDAISIFEENYATVDLSKLTDTSEKNIVNDLHAQAERTSVNMRKSNLPKDAAFAARVQMLTNEYQNGFAILSKLPQKPATSVSAEGSGIISDKKDTISMDGLRSLIQNIQSEQLRLQNLRSSDSTTIARIRTLESLLTDLRDYVGKVERKEIKLEDIPIKASDAQNFLAQFKSSETLPYLLTPSGSSSSSLAPSNIFASENIQSQPSGSVTTTAPSQMQMIPAELLNYLKNLEWSFDIKIQNKPEIGQRDRIMDRIKELEQRIAAYAYNDVPIPPALQDAFQQELRYLTTSLQSSFNTSEEEDFYPENDRLTTNNTRISDDIRMDSINSTYNPYSNTNTTNADAMIRPGFIMTDETIKRRGSASAFDESTVGGLDYKQRAKDLCRQIKSAQLGDPASFGCIENQDAVSGTYSWKGNVEMVCNRLGDTWGSWYPEMFGCPKYDSTARYRGSQFQS